MTSVAQRLRLFRPIPFVILTVLSVGVATPARAQNWIFDARRIGMGGVGGSGNLAGAIVGAVVVERIGKWPLVLAFLGAYFGLFTPVALTNPPAVAEMFRAPFLQAALFLALFMLTDPPTSPGRELDRVWVGLLVAAASVAAQLLGAGQAYLLVGLLSGNAALACRRWATTTQRRAAPAWIVT